MPVIKQRIQWTSQPQVPVRIDWSNPITRGLVFCHNAATPFEPVQGGLRNALGGGATESIGGKGKEIKFTGSVSDRACSWPAAYSNMVSGATSATYEGLFFFTEVSANPHFFGQWGSSFNQWLLQRSGSGLIWVAAEDAASNRRRWDAGSGLFSAGWNHIIASWRGGAEKTLFINGVDKTSALSVVNSTATSISTNAVAMQIGAIDGGTDLSGGCPLARVWRRGLSLAEMKSLSDNPWQIFAP